MINIIESIYRKPKVKSKPIAKNISRDKAIKIKKELSLKVLNFCNEEKTITDLTREFILSRDYARKVIRDLEVRGKVVTKYRTINGYKCKFITKKSPKN